MNLIGKVALITGGSSGIGFEIAKHLKSNGAMVAITSKNTTKLIDASKKLDVFCVPGDIQNENEVKNVIQKVVEKFNRLDILINNAGIFPKFKPLEEILDDDWKKIIDVNLNGQFRFTKHSIPFLKKNGGSVVNISSVAGLKAFENFHADAYSASKSALIQLTKSWAIHYAKYNIRFNCICPAVIETNMTKSSWLSTEKLKKATELEHPLGRIGTVTDVAKSVLFFTSPSSSWITGTVLPIDGGVSAK